MPGYPDESFRDHRRDRRPAHDYDEYDDDIYRRPAPKSRDPYDEPKTSSRRRKDTYDASDEDDYVPRHSHRHSKEKVSEEPEIPPPPIGEDRDEYAKPEKPRRKAREVRPPPGAIPVPGTEVADGYGDGASLAPEPNRRRQHGRSPYDGDAEKRSRKGVRSPYDEVEPAPRKPARSPRSPMDEEPEPISHKSHRRRDELDDPEPPRRSKGRDHEDELPRRSKPVKDPYDDLPPPKSSRHARRPPHGDDSDDYEAPPRRRRDDRDRHRYDDGYGTERPSRAKRDDYYDRGYRTDGRDARRDRHGERRGDPRRDSTGRRRDHRYADDYDDDYDRPRREKGRRGKKNGADFDEMLEKGKKGWEKAAPIAKPLLTQLANAYINNNGRAPAH
ncbi:hypothetical protein AC578_448 [Pseudocercospora eumusae]|uniref:Uncharacterized protein n=1 Tax=Pseudocercospora eumusae TaxID=321146 RepID=A0A139HXZ4_9PEZI|nr:hypothetical protein AC578_448 [Pseudocercospora eumusae]